MKTITYRSKPVKMSSHSEMDKKGNLVIQSKKEYSNSKDNRIDKIVVSKKELEAAKKFKQNDIVGFKKDFYKYCYDLKVTSKFIKTNEANHARELSHCLRHITKAVGRLDLCKQSGQYGKAGKALLAGTKVKGKANTSKLVKAKVKAAKAKKVIKKAKTTLKKLKAVKVRKTKVTA